LRDPKTDLRTAFDRFSPENMAANMPIVDLLKRFAQNKNAKPPQIALAWLMAQKPFIVAISVAKLRWSNRLDRPRIFWS
jgi:aryl-alcohol dehydrogenase-like predicted oxidoreductase